MPLAQSLRTSRLSLLQSSLQWTSLLSSRLGRQSNVPPHLLTGRRGEDEALFRLRRLGFIVVAQQWKSAMYPGDIDLIAWDGDCLCFVEVKTRSSKDGIFTAEGAVGEQKRKALRRLARIYLRRVPNPPAKKRFDVVSVYLQPEKSPEFEHIPAAFPWVD